MYIDRRPIPRADIFLLREMTSVPIKGMILEDAIEAVSRHRGKRYMGVERFDPRGECYERGL
jgi:hypothetical protein